MIKPIPSHLKKYVNNQNYSRYTAEDQAVWRYIMRQLKSFLKKHAHPCYEEGLRKTGLTTDKIPKISEMNKMLNRFGWGAVPVSGFIPPAAFMEFQSLSYLPIACEMRSVDHIHYTPAPDIVHEAAGHAPILIDKNFSKYLKAYAKVSSHAIISWQDLELYEAIRILSDAKESPQGKSIKGLEANLAKKSKSIQYISEAGLLGRMNWWTAEYGLIGSLNNPKIFGAGLLSSIGESRECLKPKLKKIPFDMSCLDYSYDITEPQPQLFVTPSFSKLTAVLNKMGSTMAYSHGGQAGLDKAIRAKTVNSVQFNSGLQISGQVDSYLTHNDKVSFIKFSGPSQISFNYKELRGHSKSYHSHGYSTPVGRLKNSKKCLSKMSLTELAKVGIKKNKICVLQFESGIILSGHLSSILKKSKLNILMSFKACTVTYNNEILFHPEWGTFDMTCAESIPSVFGGPADKASYGEIIGFKPKKIALKKLSPTRKKLMNLYQEVATLRKSKVANHKQIALLFDKYQKNYPNEWLLGLELFELSILKQAPQSLRDSIFGKLDKLPLSSTARLQLNDGIKLSNQTL